MSLAFLSPVLNRSADSLTIESLFASELLFSPPSSPSSFVPCLIIDLHAHGPNTSTSLIQDGESEQIDGETHFLFHLG